MTSKKIWFCADLHLGHRNIMKFSPDRIDILGLDKFYSKELIARAFQATTLKQDSQAEIAEAQNILSRARDKMDELIIKQWNETIGFSDDVYILGDVSFWKADKTERLLNQMHGRLHLIRGNHDHGTDMLDRWELVKDYAEIKFDGIPTIMFHFPIQEFCMQHRGAIHIHGHTHNNLPKHLGKVLDVGMESLGKIAIEWAELKDYMATRPITPHGDSDENQTHGY
jgi:calcineurin-like phosphoesterase family protein